MDAKMRAIEATMVAELLHSLSLHKSQALGATPWLAAVHVKASVVPRTTQPLLVNSRSPTDDIEIN